MSSTFRRMRADFTEDNMFTSEMNSQSAAAPRMFTMGNFCRVA